MKNTYIVGFRRFEDKARCEVVAVSPLENMRNEWKKYWAIYFAPTKKEAIKKANVQNRIYKETGRYFEF